MFTLLDDKKYRFITTSDRQFISGFDNEMTRLGYDCGGKVGDGYCWGRYMLIYRKTNVKTTTVYARIYIRENNVVLRLFLNGIDKHSQFVENAPSYIKEVFTGNYGNCKHCHNEKDGKCQFRKSYTIDGKYIEKCNGYTFEFQEPTVQDIPDYFKLFTEFFPDNRKRNSLLP
jgi:hypothetical protein